MDWIFWMTAAGMTLAVSVLLIAALRRGQAVGQPAAAFDLQVYRDQLSEIDRDTARGLIPSDESQRLRTEISRRVLEADRAAQVAVARGVSGPGIAAMALVPLVMAGAFATYWQLGAPGYPDMPMAARLADAQAAYETRPPQAEAEADVPAAAPPVAADAQYLELMGKLRQAVADRPGDLQGQQLLAQNEAKLGNYKAAYAAQSQVVALLGDSATSDDYAGLAEMMIMAAGGYVSPEAEAALTEALRRDPMNGTALYYSGLMFAQTGRPDRGFQLWRGLYENSLPNEPWMAPLAAQLEAMAAQAGEQYQMQALAPMAGPLAGPTAEDMAAAGEMSAEDRDGMIRGMVEQLSERLAAQGGSAQEWAQLLNALGVLGEAERAKAIWAEAQTRFAGRDEDLAVVRAAAVSAGVVE